MNKYRLSSIILLVILGTISVAIYLVMAGVITPDYREEMVYQKTSPERRNFIFESKLEKILQSGEKILFRSGDMFVQFNVAEDKHLVMMIPLSVSIPYAKPVTRVRFFMKTRYHNIVLSAKQEVRLREIPELQNAPVKITSKRKTLPERFIEIDLGTDVKRASEIAEKVIQIFHSESDYELIHTYADFREIRW